LGYNAHVDTGHAFGPYSTSETEGIQYNPMEIIKPYTMLDDFNQYMRFISTIPYVKDSSNEFRFFLPSSNDEYNSAYDANFFKNIVITKEFINGIMGGRGASDVGVAVYKNL
jgi:hypothetical protein